jgi:SecD/SecF fusion protein
MKKSKGIFALVLVLLAITGLIYLATVGIGEEKVGAASNIKQGLDLAGGVSITYQVVGEETPTTEDMDDTIYKLQQRVSSYSTEAIVYKEGSKRINIEIPGETDEGKILTELGKPGSLYFIMEDGTVILNHLMVKTLLYTVVIDQQLFLKEQLLMIILFHKCYQQSFGEQNILLVL